MGMAIYAQKMNYDWLYHICENYYNKINVLVISKFFGSITLNRMVFRMKIGGNRQPLVVINLSLHFYSITFIL